VGILISNTALILVGSGAIPADEKTYYLQRFAKKRAFMGGYFYPSFPEPLQY